jgi:outer membrane protein assembly factor BamA
LDRLFFSGGSNSVRAWEARRLRYLRNPETSEDIALFQDLIGGATILEGSVELRWKFSDKETYSSFVEKQIQSSGITFFLDYGNTFNNLNEYTGANSIALADMIRNIAIGWGFGYRYDTPVGPARLDLAAPVYDPLANNNEGLWFPDRRQYFRIQIGIGHAF